MRRPDTFPQQDYGVNTFGALKVLYLQHQHQHQHQHQCKTYQDHNLQQVEDMDLGSNSMLIVSSLCTSLFSLSRR